MLAPVPLYQSSGDLIADRRFAWASRCEAEGDLAAAAELLEQTLARVPNYAPAWYALAQMRERTGDIAGALAAYRQACDADPGDRLGAGVHLVRLGAAPAGAMPQAYVRQLFDQYAPAFEVALRTHLNYRGPELLRDAVAVYCRECGRPVRFDAMLDLGCGTGLAGAAFHSCVDSLSGVDLSPAMIARAERKRIYDRLTTDDMLQFLETEAGRGACYDLMVAADVLIYVAHLDELVAAVAKVLVPGGLFAFSVETHDGGNVVLGDALRYAHGERHVRDVLSAAGLAVGLLERHPVRNEKGRPVPGLIVVAKSPST